jgi:ribosomal protein L7/L12
MSIVIIIGVVVVLVVAGISWQLAGQGETSEPPPNLTDDDILKIAQQGQKIEAIKLYRALYGVGLKDAKDAVEKMIR